MLSPDQLESAESVRSVDVPNNSDGDHWWSLDDGHSFHDLLLVHLRTRLVCLSNNVSHTSLVAKEGGEMNRLPGVILRESLDLSTMTLAPLLGVEAHGTMTGRRKLTMRLQRRAKQ